MQYDLTKMSLGWLVSQHGIYVVQAKYSKNPADIKTRDDLANEISRRLDEEAAFFNEQERKHNQ